MPEDPRKRWKIVVPTDFSGCAAAALARALELARVRPCEIVLLHVVEVPLGTADWNLVADVDAIARQLRKDARDRVAALVASADPGRTATVRGEVVDGIPADAIVELATREGADLVAIASHGRTGLGRLLLGSVAERVARLAPCDVLVVHPRASAGAPVEGARP